MGLTNKLVSKAIGNISENVISSAVSKTADKFGFLPTINEAAVNYKYPNTSRIAPDCLAFINGSSVLKFGNGETRNFKNDILSVNISMSIEGSPGTASIDLFAPIHNFDGETSDPYFVDNDCIIKPMMEVEIYMKGRFSTDYYPVFWGLIGSVSESYSDGGRSLSISCNDILRWWQLTNVNIKPSAAEAQYTNTVMTAYATSFAGKTPHDIIVELTKTTMNNLIAPQGYVDQSRNADQIFFDYALQSDSMIDYWQARFEQLGRRIRLFGVDHVEEQKTQRPTINSRQIDGDSNIENERNEEWDITYKCIFDVDGIEKFTPYHILETASSDAFTSLFRNKLEIAKDVSETIQWEFFCDLNGEIIFKPPFYNLDVRKNRASVIDMQDILNENYTINEAGILTRIDVQGRFHQAISTPGNLVYGYFQDHILAKKYGLRIESVEIPFITSAAQCSEYAALELARRNALEHVATVTIVGRPELRLGYPVYLSHRDEFYYLTGIDHTFSFGGDFDTTLTLVGRRKKVYKDTQKLHPLRGGVYQKTSNLGDTNSILASASFETSLDFTQLEADITDEMQNDFITGNELGYYKLVESGVLVDQDEQSQIPYTDLEGYTLIGRYDFGIQSEVGQNDSMSDRDFSNITSKISKIENVRDMSPQYTFNVDPSNIAISLNKSDLMMLSNSGDANIVPKFVRQISDTLSLTGQINTMVNRISSSLKSGQLQNISRKKIEQIATKKISELSKQTSLKSIGKSLSKMSPF